MIRKPITPIPAKPSQYGIDPSFVKSRASKLPGMVSVMLKDLFPDLPDTIYPAEGNAIENIRKAARESLYKIDMSMIKPEDSVNILASHHGFTLFGGEPYAELLKAIKDVVEERTGSKNVRLRAGVGMRFRETEEYIKRYGLDTYFGKGKAIGLAPIDEGIPIETEIGTLYGLKKIYDADWIIHAHHTDVREVHFHRQVDKAVKPFGMSYARIETRSTYHQNLGPRAANFTARAIFESEFVQSKFAFASFMDVGPHGIVGVDSDNDLYALNDRATFIGCQRYGKIMTLFGDIDECIAVLDFPCPVPYVFAAGVIYANFLGANTDLYDLENNALPAYTWYTEAFYDKQDKPILGNPHQLSTNILNTDLLNMDVSNPNQSNPHQSSRERQKLMRYDEIGCDSVEEVKELVLKNIEYEYIKNEHNRERLGEIVDLMVETLCSTKETINVAGDDYPAKLVKEKLLRINSLHIDYVFECLGKTTTYIRNIKRYLLATLFNAPSTIDNYYSALVNHDLYRDF